MTEALERYLARPVRVLRQANEVSSPPADQPSADRTTATASQRTQRRRQERRDYRLARYEQVHALRAQGASLGTIAQQTGISRRSVQRFLSAQSFPERRPRPRRAPSIAPYLPYLRERWAAGCHNAFHLWQEVCAQGFAGSYGVVADCLRAWRHHPADAPPAATTLVLADDPSPRQVCWLLLRHLDTLTAAEHTYLNRLYQALPKVAVAESLVEEFATILREKDVPGWYAWLHGLEICAIPELQAVAHSMWQDRAAIEAAVQHEWSNGQVEGAVNRLKTTKRTMYGRANFDLLKLRVLHAA